jgi:Helicase conserved C-terminal domain/DNA polymerase Ligase (LigD)/SNF2-related domain
MTMSTKTDAAYEIMCQHLDTSGHSALFEKQGAADYAPGLPSKSDMGHADKLRVGQLLDYIIQHHKAERAGPHYDVRFGSPETGLLSWASRKGVPQPGEKHLAVQQPVHRHGYKDFEGEIPEGYGKGTVKKHTEGQILLTKVTPHSIHFSTASGRYPERFTLARPKGWDRNWLLMNTTPRAPIGYQKLHYKKIPPEQVEPALKTIQEGTTAEAKIDGASQLIQLAKGHAEALSFRTSKVTGGPIVHTERLFGGRPEIKVPPHLEGSILKGEAYASPGPGRAGTAQDVGTLLNSSIARSLQLQKERGLTLRNMLYDVQQYGRKPIDPAVTPRADRRKMLEEIAAHLPTDKFHVSEEAHGPEAATKLWNLIRSGKHPLTQEGIIIHPKVGIPSKAKLFEDVDAHITGVFPGEGKRRETVGGFTYGRTAGGPTVGRVGTGLSDAFLKEVAQDPSAYIGRVARLKAQQQFPSGALRAPSFIALHEDYPNKPGGSLRKTGSACARTGQARVPVPLVDLPLQLRNGEGHQKYATDKDETQGSVVRLPAIRAGAAALPHPWHVQDAHLRRMEPHGSAVHQPGRRELSLLRSPGDQSLSKVADVRELLRGHGRSSEGQAPGTSREQRAIQSLELLLGHATGTNEKQAQQPSTLLQWGDADAGRMVRANGVELRNHHQPDRPSGLVRRESADHESPTQTAVGSDHPRRDNPVGLGVGAAGWDVAGRATPTPSSREAIPGSDTSIAKLAGFFSFADPEPVVDPNIDPVTGRPRRQRPIPPPTWTDTMRDVLWGRPNAIVPEIVKEIEEQEEKTAEVQEKQNEHDGADRHSKVSATAGSGLQAKVAAAAAAMGRVGSGGPVRGHGLPRPSVWLGERSGLGWRDWLKSAEVRGPEDEYCPHCDARQERGDDGRCNRCGKPWPEPRVKKGEVHPVLADLLRAKAESDRGNYPAKHQIIRDLITARPDEFSIDSQLGPFVGLTHTTGFRMHVPRGVISGVLSPTLEDHHAGTGEPDWSRVRSSRGGTLQPLRGRGDGREKAAASRPLLDLPLSLRDGTASSGSTAAEPGNRILRMPAPGTSLGCEPEARSDDRGPADSRMAGLAQHVAAMYRQGLQGVSPLWRPGGQGLPKVAGVRELLSRHGAMSRGTYARSTGKQQGLFQAQLPLGHAKAASREPSDIADDHVSWQDAVHRGLGSGTGASGTYDPVSPRSAQVDRRGSADDPFVYRSQRSIKSAKVADNVSTLPDGRVLDIGKLIDKSKGRRVESIPIDDVPKPSRSEASGYSKARQAKVDMSKPVIVGTDGTLYDGRHRLFRHIDEGETHIRAVRVSDADIDDVTICDDCKAQGDKIDKNRIEMLPAKAAGVLPGEVLRALVSSGHANTQDQSGRSVRSAGSDRPRAKQAGIPQQLVDLSLRLRDGEGHHGLSADREEEDAIMWLFCPRAKAAAAPDTWPVRQEGPHSLAQHDPAVYRQGLRGLSRLWWSGDHGLRKLAEVRELLPRYGPAAAGHVDRAEGQPRPILTRQLQMGDHGRTGEKQAEQPAPDGRRSDTPGGGLGGTQRSLAPHHQVATGSGRLGYGRGETTPNGHLKLADLLPWVNLQPQQKRVAKRVGEGQNLLVFHGLGSGKSLAGIAAAEGVGGPYTAVVPASLRPNYEGEISKFTNRTTPSEVLSYTGVGMGLQPKQDPDTVIMDEVQRLRNPDSEASQAAMNLATRAKHKVLLSGTPIVNAPSDLAVPLSILTGEEMSPASFTKRFVGTKTVDPGWMGWFQGVQPAKVPTIKDEEGLERLLENHVDYQPSRTPEGVKTRDERVEVDLSPEQQDFYKLMWGKLPWMTRWKLSNDYPLTGPELTHLSSFMTGPRQAALSLYPYHSSKDPIHAFKTSAKLQSAMGSLKKTLAKDPRAKALVYSNFIDAGLTPYGAALRAEGIPFGQFHGTMTEEDRKQALSDYNAGKLRVLLLGPAAAEGISAKGTQLIQLLDPHWNEARLGQARGRGLRFDSHEGLPPELRNVRIQRFVAKMPKPGWLGRLFGDTARPSADEVLEQQSRRKEELNDQFREVLRRVGSPGYQRPWHLFG